MKFGAPQPELMPGARNAVETCLGVRPGEHVALIADEASRAVAASRTAAEWVGSLVGTPALKAAQPLAFDRS